MSPPLLTIRDLRVTLGGNPILRGLDAELPRGEVTALIGLNGAGKTTLLRTLIRETPASACTGVVQFHCGHDHSGSVVSHIGYVPQRLRLEGQMPLTVLDLFAISLRRWPLFLGLGHKFRAHVRELLATAEAEHLVNRFVDKLSGGELQRVLLALALEPSPELLLLDEPAAGIDFQTQNSFYNLINSLNQRTGVTVLLVSHDLSMVSQVAQNVLCLKDGRIECQGSPQEILQGETLARIFGLEMGLFVHKH